MTYNRIVRFAPETYYVQADNAEFVIYGDQFAKVHRTTENLAVASKFLTVLCAKMLLNLPHNIPIVDADGRITRF